MKLSPEKRIRVWMIRNDVAMNDLARRIGQKPSHLSNILALRRNATQEISDALKRETGVRIPLDRGARRRQHEDDGILTG